MVLNVIVSSPRQIFGDLCPLVSILLMSFDDDFIFLLSPLSSFDVRVKMVMPSLSALFTYSSRKIL